MKKALPSIESIKEMQKFAKKLPSSATLPPNASKLDREKYKLCREFVIYLTESEMTQAELAKKLKINRTRVSEIVNYKIKRLSLDTLFELLEKIDKKAELKVA